MSRIVTLALKDLKVLSRDKFGMFWVLAFPLLMALFFGAMFSGSGGGSRGSMKIGMVTDNQSPLATEFYEQLGSSSVVTPVYVSSDSASRLVSEAKLTAYVHYRDTSTRVISMFSGDTSLPIEVGIDPSRRAERGYLQGLISQAYFQLLQARMMDPTYWRTEMDRQLAALDTARGLSGEQKELMGGFMSNLRDFMGTVDTASDTAERAAAIENSPFGGVSIDFHEVTVDRIGPRSAWEITFPQSLQWALIGVCAAFAVGIVVEHTRGTYLRLRLAPISRVQILAGKGLACFMSAVVVCAFLMAVGIVLFDVRIASLTNLVLALVSAGLCFVGLMMLISVLGRTEQSVGGAGWAILLVLAMTGGGMIPLFMMPNWMATIGSVSAVKWSVMAFEGAIWRNLSTAQMMKPVGILLAYGLVSFSIGVYILRRRDA